MLRPEGPASRFPHGALMRRASLLIWTSTVVGCGHGTDRTPTAGSGTDFHTHPSPVCDTTTRITGEVALDAVEPISGVVPIDLFGDLAQTRTDVGTWENGSTVELTLGLTTDAATASQEFAADSCGNTTNVLTLPLSLVLSAIDGSLDEVVGAEGQLDLQSGWCNLDQDLDWTALDGTFDLVEHLGPVRAGELERFVADAAFRSERTTGSLDAVFDNGAAAAILSW
jgi:hypothetical protein